MANNLFISYDLYSPGQNYDDVIEEIKSLGSWAKVQKSFWYVNSTLSANQARERVWAKMDKNDSLIVIDATNNDAASNGLSAQVWNHLSGKWFN
ncbi:CRISPR-associated protein Cas2 [Vibrio parahaemolyticus]|nr:CRISPR-associated protein Cas2 [Vibrio parahaemolyticus]